MNKVVHFEIPADDLERAKKFYSEIFGWQLQDVPGGHPYTLAMTSALDENQKPKEPGTINGGMLQKFKEDPVQTISITIDVDSIDESLKKIEAEGGKMIREKMPVGDMGFVAYFQDPEGNVVGLWETVKK